VPDLEVRRLLGRIADASGTVLGEARLWAAGERGDGGGWWGWIRAVDLGAPLASGRYTFISIDGWEASLETGHAPPTRVFETELIPFRGEGGVPWPAVTPPPLITDEAEPPPS